MTGKFISSNNKHMKKLVDHIVNEVNYITLMELQSKSQVPPSMIDVMMNEYMVIMQVCSHAMMNLLSNTAVSAEMMQGLTKDDMKNFIEMSESERKTWATKRYSNTVFRKNNEN